jgi:Smg protein
MFDVLVYVYENFWGEASCPQPDALERSLHQVGFELDHIQAALSWLDGLQQAAEPLMPALGLHHATALEPSARSMRIYTKTEQRKLGGSCLGFLSYLEQAGILTAVLREVVVERAMATSGQRLNVNHLKLIVLMVFWSFKIPRGGLVLDELCAPTSARLAH